MFSTSQDYSSGIKTFLKQNHRSQSRLAFIQRMLKSFQEESVEFLSELLNCNFISAFNELLDVWHSYIWILVSLLVPDSILYSDTTKLWYIVYFLSLIAAPYKHGVRFKNHGCIRSSRNCKSGTHLCNHKENPNNL